MGHSLDHLSDEDLLLEIDGELSSPRQRAVDLHLVQCQACRGRRQRLRSLLQETSALYQSDFADTPAGRDESRVRLALALDELGQTWERSWSMRVRRALAQPQARTMLVVAAPVLLLTVWLSGSSGSTGRGEGPPDGALPKASFTPGAVATMTAADLCTGARPSRLVLNATRDQVLAAYRMQHVDTAAYELDALITPELGGTVDAENLWPQLYASPTWNARVKDELERLLPDLVCRGEIDLAQAQREIATDWIAAYKRYFKTETPLRAHLGPPLDDAELEFETPHVVASAMFTVSFDPVRLIAERR
jgi:hypothetical protein